jgi:type I restriction enzyme S subunit
MSQAENQVIPEGYKQTEVGVIPSDWNNMPLRAALKESPKYGINAAAVPLQGDLPVYIRITDISEDGYFKPSEKVGVNSLLSNLYKLKSGDTVLARTGASVGKSYLYRESDGELVYAGFLIKVSPNTEILNPEFLFQYLKTEQYWAWIIVNSMRSGQPGVNGNEFGSLLVPIPRLEEQTAIATALSDMDALLSELEKLIAKKQAIKTATMQQLLTGKTRLPQFAFYSDINSTEGAVEGKRSNASATNVNVGACDDGSLASQESGGMDSRRKGTKPSELGEIPEDWEVYALSSLLNESPKYGINAAAVPLVGSLPVYIRITDISEGGYFRPKEKVGVDSSLSYLYKLNKGDLVLARTGASVGKSYLYRDIDGELVYAGFLIKISPNTKKLSSEYLSHYLKTDQYWSWITVNSMRSGQPGVNGNEFGSLQLPVPDIKEQTAIASILSDMDNEIQTLEQRLSKTRQIKQGMMQELLTGKTRLPFARLAGESDAD